MDLTVIGIVIAIELVAIVALVLLLRELLKKQFEVCEKAG